MRSLADYTYEELRSALHKFDEDMTEVMDEALRDAIIGAIPRYFPDLKDEDYREFQMIAEAIFDKLMPPVFSTTELDEIADGLKARVMQESGGGEALLE